MMYKGLNRNHHPPFGIKGVAFGAEVAALQKIHFVQFLPDYVVEEW